MKCCIMRVSYVQSARICQRMWLVNKGFDSRWLANCKLNIETADVCFLGFSFFFVNLIDNK